MGSSTRASGDRRFQFFIPPTSPSGPTLIEVAAGLVFREGRLLITQRYAGAHQGGLWEFPGGKREAGESYEACLARELMEELGIEVCVGELFEAVTHAYPEKTVHLRFYLCSLAKGEPQALGCATFKWVGREDLDRHSFPAADARLLDALAGQQKLWGGERGSSAIQSPP